MILGTKIQRKLLYERLISFASYAKPEVRNLGVILDSELCFIPDINTVTKVALYYLRNIVKVWPFLFQNCTGYLYVKDRYVLLLVFQALNGHRSTCVPHRISAYVPAHDLRSADTGLLQTPSVKYRKQGGASFSYASKTEKLSSAFYQTVNLCAHFPETFDNVSLKFSFQ